MALSACPDTPIPQSHIVGSGYIKFFAFPQLSQYSFQLLSSSQTTCHSSSRLYLICTKTRSTSQAQCQGNRIFPCKVPSFPPKLEGGLVKLADVRLKIQDCRSRAKPRKGERLELTANRWGLMMKKEGSKKSRSHDELILRQMNKRKGRSQESQRQQLRTL